MAGYPQTLKYFMWKWQVHFMLSCKVGAESVFNKIDRRLLPSAFLIGTIADPEGRKEPICFEPEKMEFLKADFAKLKQVAAEVDSDDPWRNMIYTGEGIQQEMDERKKKEYLRDAIKEILDRSNSFTDRVHFVAQSVLRDGYHVYVVLQLNKTIYNSYKFLHYVDPKEFLKKSLSLIDSTISEYLRDSMYQLYNPDAGKGYGIDRPADEILRHAARDFSFTIAHAGRGHGLKRLLPACDALSVMSYEGKENLGHMILCRKDHPDLEMTLELETPFSLSDYRKVRKLLELTNDEVGVVFNNEDVLGLGRVRDTYTGENEDIFTIRFLSTHCYDILHQSQQLLVMRYGLPVQIRQVIIFDRFQDDAKRIFESATDEQIREIYELSTAAAQSGKGCMLVFLNDAAEESARLRKQSISIKTKKLDRELIQALSSIDGAVLIDLEGKAYAKGVILDGIAGLEGDASRGSRYNSALTYCEYRGWAKPTLIVVVSEDGMVDVIPGLIPRIRHSEIKQFIKTLESLNTEENFISQAFYNSMDLLKERQFYLTAEECEKINLLKDSLERFDAKSQRTMWQTFDDFEPDPRMSDRFYYPES